MLVLSPVIVLPEAQKPKLSLRADHAGEKRIVMASPWILLVLQLSQYALGRSNCTMSSLGHRSAHDSRSASVTPVGGVSGNPTRGGGMEELLPLVMQLINAEQVSF